MERIHAVGTAIEVTDDKAVGAVALSGPTARFVDHQFQEEFPDRIMRAANRSTHGQLKPTRTASDCSPARGLFGGLFQHRSMIQNYDNLADSSAQSVALDCIKAGIRATLPARIVAESVEVADGVLHIADGALIFRTTMMSLLWVAATPLPKSLKHSKINWEPP